ncbi:MAG: autotransporter-associated beta strand repeat-containing protein [Alphaproteobacteria bacterium]
MGGDILDNSHLVSNRSDDFTIAGGISGTGTFEQAGTGTITMLGDNLYSGGTTISSGTLQLGNGGSTGSVTGNITDNSHLIIDRGGVYTFNGVISGGGDVTKAGSGITKIAQTQTYTGATISRTASCAPRPQRPRQHLGADGRSRRRLLDERLRPDGGRRGQ